MNIRCFTAPRSVLAAALLAVVLLLLPHTSNAVTTTTLLSQDFSSGAFPPAGWSASQVRPQGSYTYGSGYWYRSNYGNGGANGSAVAWVYYGYGYYSSTEVTLTTPPVDASNYTTDADSTFVDFDLWSPYNYYDYYYCNNGNVSLTVKSGSTTLTNPKSPSMWTVRDNNYYGFSDPGSYGYYSSSYWRHYHVYVPKANRTSSMSTTFDLVVKSSAYYYTYSDNLAIDNVVISNNHYDFISVLGPMNLNFGSVPVGQSAGPYYVKVQNNSNRDFNLSNYAIGGLAAGDFSVSRAPATLPVGATDSIGVIYTPTSKNQRNATLTFTSDADNGGTVSVTLQGYGLVPLVSLPPTLTSLFRKSHIRLGRSVTQSFVVTSSGQVPLHIDPTSYVGGDYPDQYQIVRLPGTIAPGQSDTVTISFSPTVEWLMSATLFLKSDADQGTQQIPLKGVGILPRLVINAPPDSMNTLAFDSVAMGDSVCSTVMLSNTGTDTVRLTRQIMGSADYDFSFYPLGGSDTMILPGASKLVNVCFHPIKNGNRLATVRFYTDIPATFTVPRIDTSQFILNVTGIGVPYGILSLRGTADTSVVGAAATCIQDTIVNTGASDLTVTKAMLAGPTALSFAVSGLTFPITLTPGAMQVFNICFTATARGITNDTMVVSGTSSGRALTMRTPIEGVGVAQCASSEPAAAVTFPGTGGITQLKMTGDTTIVVSNCGDIAETFAVTGVSAPYSVTPATSPAVPAGGTATFHVSFAPTQMGTANQTLTITGGPTPIALTLDGIGGDAVIAANDPSPKIDVGDCINDTVTVTNTGNMAWTATGAPTISGANASDFTWVSGPGTVPAGGTGTMIVKYCANAAGPETATLTFSETPVPSAGATSIVLTAAGRASSGVALVTSANGFSLGQSYPNPTSGAADMVLTMPSTAMVNVDLVDAHGALVKSVFHGELGQGDHTLALTANNLPNGAYFCVVTSGETRLAREITVMH